MASCWGAGAPGNCEKDRRYILPGREYSAPRRFCQPIKIKKTKLNRRQASSAASANMLIIRGSTTGEMTIEPWMTMVARTLQTLGQDPVRQEALSRKKAGPKAPPVFIPRLLLLANYCTTPPITAGGAFTTGSCPIRGSIQELMLGRVKADTVSPLQSNRGAACIRSSLSRALTK